jgi:type I site-specific restriction endonuclease
MGMLNEAEWLTRKKRIDTRLCALTPPWKIIRYHDGLNLSSLHCVAVEEFPTANGPADYALFVNGVLLGIIEAKKVTVNPQNVLEQAKRYSAGASQGLSIKSPRTIGCSIHRLNASSVCVLIRLGPSPRPRPPFVLAGANSSWPWPPARAKHS